MLPPDYMVDALLVQGNGSQLFRKKTMGRSDHLEHPSKYNILVNSNCHGEYTQYWKNKGQEIASKATGTLFTHVSFNMWWKRVIGKCLLIPSYSCLL